MARQTVLTAGPKTAGTYAYGPFAVPGSVSVIRVDIDVTAARDGDDVIWTAEVSPDGGVTWPVRMSGSFLGGVPKRLDGQAVSAPLISTDTVQLPSWTNRTVRGTIVIMGATRKVSAGVELL